MMRGGCLRAGHGVAMPPPAAMNGGMAGLSSSGRNKAMIGGAVAAALLVATPGIQRWEGKRNATYLDVVGVPTACYGHTGPDTGPVGKRWTDVQCDALLREDIAEHMEGALGCVPALRDRVNQLAAATMLTFNIGVAAFCRSTVARRFNAGDWAGGCAAFSMWVKAGGITLRGLVNRRAHEREICMRGLG